MKKLPVAVKELGGVALDLYEHLVLDMRQVPCSNTVIGRCLVEAYNTLRRRLGQQTLIEYFVERVDQALLNDYCTIRQARQWASRFFATDPWALNVVLGELNITQKELCEK